MFSSAPIHNVLSTLDVIHEAVLQPWYKTEISRTGENHGIPCQVCKKNYSFSTVCPDLFVPKLKIILIEVHVSTRIHMLLNFQAVMVCCRADEFELAQEVCNRLWPKKDRKDKVL